jgi:hypothetical protein
MADWETVRETAGALPAVEEGTCYGQPAFRVRRKLFAWMSPSNDARGALVVRVDLDEKRLLIESHPDVYFSTPHYEGYPSVLVRLDRIEPDELAERIEDAWLIQAPKRLAAAYLADSGPIG